VIKQEVDAFLSALADTPELWRSVHLRVVAIWADNAWQNLATSVFLDARSPRRVPLVKDLPKLERIIAIQEVLPIQVLPSLIQRLRVRGSLNVSGTTVGFLTDGDGGPFSKPYGHAYHSRGLSLDDYIRGPFERGHVLGLYASGGAYQLFREFPGGQNAVDVALRLAGWQGLDELVLRGLGEVAAPPYNTGRRISFIAPIEAVLLESGCSLRDGELEYEVFAGSRAAGGSATLTVTGEDASGKRVGLHIPLKKKPWTSHDGGWKQSARIRVPKSGKLYLTLHTSGYELGRLVLLDQGKTVARPPLLMLAHDALFKTARPFPEVLLAPRSSEGREFERAVSKLFTYCGFPTDQPGKVPQEQNGPDVLVEVPGRNLLLVIETTVKHLMNDEDGKLNRLTKRSSDVRYAVKNLDVEVVPLMVVPWPRETLVPVELEEAEKNGVRVLSNEDLSELLSMALAHRSLREVAHYLVPEPPTPPRTSFSERNPLAD
jgi:hypothetical protein